MSSHDFICTSLAESLSINVALDLLVSNFFETKWPCGQVIFSFPRQVYLLLIGYCGMPVFYVHIEVSLFACL